MRKWLFLIILLALIGGTLYYITFGHYSDGTRVGTLTKLSRRGYIFKTNEGQLMEGGMTDGTGTFSSKLWEFSVDDENKEALEALGMSQKTGQRISVHYEQKVLQLPWNGDTQYFVTSVELIPLPMMQSQPVMVAPPAPAPVKQDSASN